MCNFVAIKNTKIKSLCKPLEIEFKKNFFLCKLLRAVTVSHVVHILHSSLYKILLPFPAISFRLIWTEMRHVFADNFVLEEHQKHKTYAVTALWHRDLSLLIAQPSFCRIVIRV